MLITGRLPRLGNWMFYFWISKPNNRQKVDEAMEAYAKGKWNPTTKGFIWKQKIIAFIKNSKTKFLFYITLVTNVIMVPLFFIIRDSPDLAGSLLSVIAGILFLVNIVLNFLVFGTAAAFYCDKGPENKKQRYKVELLSWGYYLIQPFMFIFIIFSVLIKIGYGDQLDKIGIKDYSVAAGNTYWNGSIVFYILQIVLIGISLLSFIKGNSGL